MLAAVHYKTLLKSGVNLKKKTVVMCISNNKKNTQEQIETLTKQLQKATLRCVSPQRKAKTLNLFLL